MDYMARMQKLRSLVPATYDIKQSEHEPHVALVLLGDTAATVINLDRDIERQVANDTCELHGTFCCVYCFNQTTISGAAWKFHQQWIDERVRDQLGKVLDEAEDYINKKEEHD